MKTAGIITFHCADNFGAVLQCYALKEYVSSENIKTEIIDYSPSYITDGYSIWPSKDTVKRYYEIGGRKHVIKALYLERLKTLLPRIKKVKKFNHFRKKHIGMKGIKIEKSLSYDYYIAGSDQIWNPKLTNGVDDKYYLDFVPSGKKRISYAASIGTDNVDGYEDVIKTYLDKFDFISVREQSCKNALSKFCNKDINVVVDPVFLLSQKQWIDIVDDKERIKGKFIFFYCFDNNKAAIDLVNYLSDKYDLPVVHFYFGGLRAKINKDGGCFYFDGPIDFLWYIKNAEYVVTGSFHCVAFSLIYGKKFYPFIYSDRGSRIVDLLQALDTGIEAYNYDTKLEEIKECCLDYDNIANNIQKLSLYSKEYLKNAFKE